MGSNAATSASTIIDRDHREERLQRLACAGIDVAAAETSGHLELLPWEQAHVVGGHFDQHRMPADLEKQAARGSGYRATRLWSNQEWALQDLPGVEDIVEYEARFNHVWPKYDGIFVCVFDASRFGAAVLMQVLRSHPFAIIGGILRETPVYVPPDELLQELRGQRAGRD